jgi:hypothetical protein
MAGSSMTRTTSTYVSSAHLLSRVGLLIVALKWYLQQAGGGWNIKNVEAGQFASVSGNHNGSKLRGSGNATTWDLRQDGNEYL